MRRSKRKKYTSEFKREAVRLMESTARPSTPRQLGAAQSCSIVLRLLISVEQPCERKND